jgi:uncharacterized protein (DUF849 family)
MPDERLIIVAPNGARRGKADHPALPITPEEIADEVARCADAGAAMVHLHARTPTGEHSLEIDDNAAVLDAVRQRVGERIIVQITTEAVGRYAPEQQMRLIRTLQPEAASFALRELIPDEHHASAAAEFFHWCAEARILAQYILYSAEDLQRYLDLRRRGLLPADCHHLLFVLGRYSKDQQSSPDDLAPFTALTDQLKGKRWAVCAFGQREQACLLEAARHGGDVRIGFENNLFSSRGDLARNNAEQVEDLVQALEKIDCVPMNAAQARACFSVYGSKN